MGGRSSAGGNKVKANARSVEPKATSERQQVSQEVAQLSTQSIDKATFKKDITGSWDATAGTIINSYGESIPNAVDMRILSNREDGKTYYTTRFVVKHTGGDWQYSDERYNSLNEAKKAVKSDVKSYLNDRKKRK